MDSDTQAAREVLVAEIKASREVEECKMIVGRIDRGEMRADLLPEADVDEERAADPTPYGRHVGDFLFHNVK
jgi:hypothetical protein